jgi:long-chain acyl-CoA synthetase
MGSYNEQKSWLKTYPEWLPREICPPGQSLLDEFVNTAKTRPASPCIHYFDHTLSYTDIKKMAVALAAALFDMGTAESDRVVVVMQNIPQAVIACLAIWMRNAVVVPLNPMYTADELTYYLDDCGTRLLICQDDLYEDRISKAAADRPDMIVITTSPLDLLGNPSTQPEQFLHATKRFFTDTHDFISLVNSCSNRDTLIVYPSADALAYLVYTSGTTGPAKGAMIRHDNVVHNAIVYREACRLNRDDVVLGAAPLFHITGIVAHQAIAFHLGIPMVLFARFDVREALRLIETYRVTFTVAAITVYIAMLNFRQLQNFDLSSFKKAYSGGAPVSPATVKKFIDSMGLTIYNVYGLTESCSPATITPLGMEGPVDEDSGALSVGLIIPGHEAWIVDIDNHNIEVPPGAEGELVLRGPGIIDGYWEKPDETANAIKNGRFFTGDVAKFDEHGWCFIVDRKKDLINVSGYKVWPRDVEDVLYRHPAVSEAAVVGVPDEYRGETVKAFVSISKDYQGWVTSEELIAFCKEHMAAYKYPRIVEIIEEIPKTATGKFLRRQLRES